MKRAFALALLGVVFATAASGQEIPPLEIDQTCAVETGCFEGDDPGFPVTITEPGIYVLTGNLFNDNVGVYTIDGNNVADIDLNGFRLSGPQSFDAARGISNALSVRNGRVQYLRHAVEALLVEDVSVGGFYAIVSTPVARRSSFSPAFGLAIWCQTCLLEDVSIGCESGQTCMSVEEARLLRVRALRDQEIRVSGSAEIVDSAVGYFSIGDNSFVENTTVNCFHVPGGPTFSVQAGDDSRMSSSEIVSIDLARGCSPTFGSNALIEQNSMELSSRLTAGSSATLRSNTINFSVVGYHGGISLGPGAIVENNLIDGHDSNEFATALAAGEGSRIMGNTIQRVPDGIVCPENCLVSGNSITNYSGTAMQLGPNSYYFNNLIDDSGLAEVSGGIGLDPTALGSPSSTAALNGPAQTDTALDVLASLATDSAGQWLSVWVSDDDMDGTIGSDTDILLAGSSDNGLTWSAPIALNKTAPDDSADDTEPMIVADAAGNWVVAWSSTEDLSGAGGTDRDILFARSADQGTTWTNVAALNVDAALDTGDDERPFITTNGGIFLAAWQSNDGSSGPDFDIRVSRSFTGGASWTPSILLNSNGGGDSAQDIHPVLATDSAGNWLAVWESNDAAFGGESDLFVARSIDDGGTWTSPLPLDQNAAIDTGIDTNPTIATDGSGTWIVAWDSTEPLEGTIGVDRDVIYSRSTDNGTTWTAPQALNSNAGSDTGDDISPHLLVDSSGTWTVAWNSNEPFGGIVGDDDDIFVARSTDGGMTWTAPAVLNKNAAEDLGGDTRPQIATNPTGDHVVAVWHSDDDLAGTVGIDSDIFYSSIDRCGYAGALPPSTSQLAAFQTNWCEDWSGIEQPGDDLQGALLDRSNLRLANLTNTSLLQVSLVGVDLSGADLTGADLVGALYDEATRFPSGTTYESTSWGLDGESTPWDAGMIPVPEPSIALMMLAGASSLAAFASRRRSNDARPL